MVLGIKKQYKYRSSVLVSEGKYGYEIEHSSRGTLISLIASFTTSVMVIREPVTETSLTNEVNIFRVLS